MCREVFLMPPELESLNQLRKEARKALSLDDELAWIYGENIEVTEPFIVKVTVANEAELGGGGKALGDAIFNNVQLHIIGDDAKAVLLDGTGPNWDDYSKPAKKEDAGSPVAGNKLIVQLGTLKANDPPREFFFWFRAEKKSANPEVPEKVAEIRVYGDFDIARYFHSWRPEPVKVRILG